jgi:DNA-binding HxlR family transcriptional regulator
MLQNAIGKITSKILARRLTKELSDRKLVHRANEGFLNGEGNSQCN